MRPLKLFYILAAIVLLFPLRVSAQSEDALGSFFFFSIYGIGDISRGGSAFNNMMGGVGIATRNTRHINFLNPAAISARDTLAFMADFGVQQKNSYFKDGASKTLFNTFNMYDFVLSFPIYRSSAIAVGITPFSDLGYNFSRRETNEDILATVGDSRYGYYGEGSIYSLFLSGAVTFWDRLSVGAELTYYFGNLERHSTIDYDNSSYRSWDTGTKHHVYGISGKFGLQYEQGFSDDYSMILGATYRMGTNMNGNRTRFAYATTSSVVDTVRNDSSKPSFRLADEIGVGVSFRKSDKWTVEFNYTRSDWRNTGIDDMTAFNKKDVFRSTVSNSFRAGFEFVPNRYDIRYYMKRVSYRGGVYYNQSYYTMNGHNVGEIGITLGFTFPVFRFYNGINVGIDFGQRGGFGGVTMRERYFKFVIGFSLHDVWFQRYRYK